MIMKKAAKALKKDAMDYEEKSKKTNSPLKKKHEKIEEKEARSAARDLKMRAKKAHEY